MAQLGLRRLTCFRTVATLGHVTRAAAQLGVPQPAVSRTLAELERDLGVPLFEREGRGVRLTAYGRAFCRMPKPHSVRSKTAFANSATCAPARAGRSRLVFYGPSRPE